MNYQTELMEEILTNEKAQEIIDYVSQIYGNSYVGLWLFQAIGSVLGPISDLSEQLTYETSPATTSLLLPYYEQEYGIQGDPTMTLQQRRDIVVAAMRSKGAITPARLADSVSAALGGVPVEIIEYSGTSLTFTEIDNLVVSGNTTGQEPDGDTSITNPEIEDLVCRGIITSKINLVTSGGFNLVTSDGDQLGYVFPGPDGSISITYDELNQIVIDGTALNQDGNLNQYTFIVNIRAAVPSTAPAVAVIEKLKPAHLTYTLQGVTQESASTNVYVGTALTTAEHFEVKVTGGA